MKKFNSEDTKRKIGNYFENYAMHQLKEDDYKILEHSYQAENKEIDIIAKQGDTVVFIEVKARKEHKDVTPENAVNSKKMKNIFFVANSYKQSLEKLHIKTEKLQFRFDMIAITYSEDYHIINYTHYKDYYIVKEPQNIFK